MLLVIELEATNPIYAWVQTSKLIELCLYPIYRDSYFAYSFASTSIEILFLLKVSVKMK